MYIIIYLVLWNRFFSTTCKVQLGVTKMKMISCCQVGRALLHLATQPFYRSAAVSYDGHRALHFACAYKAIDVHGRLRYEQHVVHERRPVHAVRYYSQATNSLKNNAASIFDAAIDAVHPEKMVKRVLQVHGNKFVVKGKEYHVNSNVYIAAFGKAVLGMVRAAEEVLQPHIVRGIASVPLGIQDTFHKAGKT